VQLTCFALPCAAAFGLKVPRSCKIAEVAVKIPFVAVGKMISVDCINIMRQQIGDVNVSIVDKLGKGGFFGFAPILFCM
jgi:hypothetical protein